MVLKLKLPSLDRKDQGPHWSFSFLFFNFFFLFFFLECMTYRILGPQPGTETRPFAVKAQSPNQWATWDVPFSSYVL